MAEIAKSWFEFKEDERMKVVIEDGLKYIQSKGLILVHLCHLTRFPDCPKPEDGREMFTSSAADVIPNNLNRHLAHYD